MRSFFGVTGLSMCVVSLLGGCGGATASERSSTGATEPPPSATVRFRPVSAPTRLDLFGVWAVSPSLAYAVGDRRTVLRWDGAAWQHESLPSTVRPDVRFDQVTGTGPSDVWVRGANIGDAPFGQETLVHYDGRTWTDVSAELPRGVYPLTGLYVAPGEVFATAYDIERGYAAVLARDPATGRWVNVDVPARHGPKIHGNGHDVVVADARNVYRRTASRGWEPIGPPTVREPMTPNLRALVVQSNGRIWLGGESGEVAVGSDGTWRSLRAGDGWVSSLWASREGIAWAVMSNAGVYTCGVEGCTLQHTVDASSRLFAIGGTTDGDVWTVGAAGTILHSP